MQHFQGIICHIEYAISTQKTLPSRYKCSTYSYIYVCMFVYICR